MKYCMLFVIILSTFASCSEQCGESAAEQMELWMSSEPDSYAYTVRKSFFGPIEYLGPYRFHIVDGVVDTVYFDAGWYSTTDPDELFEGWDDYEEVKQHSEDFLISDVFESIAKYENECTASYDPTYHFPTEFNIPSDPEIADSGFSIRVSDFEEL